MNNITEIIALTLSYLLHCWSDYALIKWNEIIDIVIKVYNYIIEEKLELELWINAWQWQG